MKPSTIVVLVLPITLFSAARSTWAAENDAGDIYQVGVAKTDVTPDYPIRLNGFGFRRTESEGIAQRIWAKTLAIGGDPSRNGSSDARQSAGSADKPVVLITLDSLGVRLDMVDEVARRLEQKAGIPRQNVMLTFSHSHTTPKVNGASDTIFGTPIPNEHQQHIDRYTNELTDRLEQSALAALADRQPSRLAWAVGKVDLAINRRTAGGPVDHDLPTMIVKDLTGRVRAVYTSYACHCVTLSFNQISGDWSGYAQELIERHFPGAVGLVSIGAGSDSNPRSGVTGDKVDVATQQGAMIADEVARLSRGEMRPISGPLHTTFHLIDVPLNDPPNREQWEQLAAGQGPPAHNARIQLSRLDRGEALLRAIHYPVQTLRFGETLCMLFLAGEVCVDYSQRIKRELDHQRIWINAYSNDFCAYIPSERLLREGGYGGGSEIVYFALPNTFRPGLEQQIMDEVRRQVPATFHAAPGTQGIPPK